LFLLFSVSDQTDGLTSKMLSFLSETKLYKTYLCTDCIKKSKLMLMRRATASV